MQSSIKFTIPTPPSLKNGVRLFRGRMVKSHAVRAAMRGIQEAAVAACPPGSLRHGTPLFGDDDVAVEIHHLVATDEVEVFISRVRPRPKGKTGRKRDLQNLQDGILDAIQGILVANDNQVVQLVMMRVN